MDIENIKEDFKFYLLMEYKSKDILSDIYEVGAMEEIIERIFTISKDYLEEEDEQNTNRFIFKYFFYEVYCEHCINQVTGEFNEEEYKSQLFNYKEYETKESVLHLVINYLGGFIEKDWEEHARKLILKDLKKRHKIDLHL